MTRALQPKQPILCQIPKRKIVRRKTQQKKSLSQPLHPKLHQKGSKHVPGSVVNK